MRFMVIDVGSNTVKYDLFSLKNQKIKTVVRRSETLRLASEIDGGVLSERGFERLCATLRSFLDEASALDCADVLAFATAAMRKLGDPLGTLAKIKERTGLAVRLLSGEEEAACSFEGMKATLKKPPKRGVMIDMGGGSTELNFFEDLRSTYLVSCPFGALATKNALMLGNALTAGDRARVRAYALSFLPGDLPAGGAKSAVLIGGTAKAFAKLARKFQNKEKSDRLTIAEFGDLANTLCAPDQTREEEIRLLCPDRFQLMATGAAAFYALFERLGVKKIYICRGGIREGYLIRAQRGEL